MEGTAVPGVALAAYGIARWNDPQHGGLHCGGRSALTTPLLPSLSLSLVDHKKPEGFTQTTPKKCGHDTWSRDKDLGHSINSQVSTHPRLVWRLGSNVKHLEWHLPLSTQSQRQRLESQLFGAGKSTDKRVYLCWFGFNRRSDAFDTGVVPKALPSYRTLRSLLRFAMGVLHLGFDPNVEATVQQSDSSFNNLSDLVIRAPLGEDGVTGKGLIVGCRRQVG